MSAMLRAPILKERSSSYICHFCRGQLPLANPTSRCRAILRNEALGAPATANYISRHRLFSTSSLLCDSPNGDSPASKGPASGGFGAVGGGFGGFAAKKATITDPVPPKPAPASQPQETSPAKEVSRTGRSSDGGTEHHSDRHKHKDSRRKHEAQKHPRRKGRQEHHGDGDKEPVTQSTVKESTAKVPEQTRPSSRIDKILDNVKTEGLGKQTQESSSQATPAAAAWGPFSQRKTDIKTPPPAAATKPAPRKPIKTTPAPSWNSPAKDWKPVNRRATDQAPVGNSSKITSFDAMLEARKSDDARARAAKSRERIAQQKREKEQGAQQSEGEFWSDLDARLTAAPRPTPVAPMATPTPASTLPTEEMAPRQSSRFVQDGQQEDYSRKKADKRKKSGRPSRHVGRGRYDNDDMDEQEFMRYEAQQRRKEERRLRKEQEAEQNEPEAVPIFLPEYINVSSLASAMKQGETSFLRDLEELGFENMTVDTIMTGEMASLIAMEYGFEPTVDNGSQRDLRPRPAPEDPSTLPPRPPIVTIMGHVDHGKTTLLDYLRKSSIVAQEHGGITQHIGAFVVKMSSGKPITFLDTPGHAAFLTMRQRGANVTDIVVLVVAADDSVKPQTLEALKHANNAKVPIIVAINKVDKEEARVEQVKADLSRHGVQIEDYGGDVQTVCVSGKTGKGMDDLEENIVTLSELLDTRAEQDGMAEGWVLESSIKQDGKVASVLVKRGTLRTGDIIVAGHSWARIRLLRNEAGAEVTEAPPGTPVEVLGWRDLPPAGTQVLQAPDEDKAKTAVDYREEMTQRQQDSAYIIEQEARERERVEAEAAAKEMEELGEDAPAEEAGPKITTQNFTVKADVAGSVEAVVASVLEQGNNEVRSRVLRQGTGQITEFDVDHAATSGSVIVNFNTAILPHISQMAKQAGVRIIDHSVIYHLVDETRAVLSALLPKSVSHKVLGEADVLQIFPINVKGRKYQNIAGCRVRNGSIKKTSRVKILRKGKVVYDGHIDTLKQVKRNVMEMGKGSECGMAFTDFEDFQIDDQIQTYDIIEEARTL
ncbi:uncharacterized protein F5Z01DRAFT_640186 [Emericellopsis atlantica]|uniref:Translation initiation factor IF-2, mitochondrial n=1 Tax=Emericellopsis atlantica TaxID=2614577 RepID=A0A9P7ZFA9_9HYPO|nr:uncharacterized protein F5Z01DRAFT_640186 [Emericellopsis atlantica]KAG9250607.1 hypothetical protein F5Z01DRAFT_640186 [Emericellopsis atlantica]